MSRKSQIKKDKQIHADAKHAKAHGKNLVEEIGNLNLDKAHKNWYRRDELGKQRGKPKYAPPKRKKSKKN